jgi:hypothetical protein
MAWEQLTAMIQEAADVDQEDRSNPPTSCAVDYTALREGPEGKMFCPWCGLVWPDDAQSWGEFPGSY